jgi:hypothetical protein
LRLSLPFCPFFVVTLADALYIRSTRKRVDRMAENIIIGFLIGTSISAILIVGVLLYQWWIIPG